MDTLFWIALLLVGCGGSPAIPDPPTVVPTTAQVSPVQQDDGGSAGGGSLPIDRCLASDCDVPLGNLATDPARSR